MGVKWNSIVSKEHVVSTHSLCVKSELIYTQEIECNNRPKLMRQDLVERTQFNPSLIDCEQWKYTKTKMEP